MFDKDQWSHKTLEDCPVCKCVTDQRVYGAYVYYECMECHNMLEKNGTKTTVVVNSDKEELSVGGIFFELHERRIF